MKLPFYVDKLKEIVPQSPRLIAGKYILGDQKYTHSSPYWIIKMCGRDMWMGRQVVIHRNKESIFIDASIAPLVMMLNLLGYKTVSCCSSLDCDHWENPEHAEIQGSISFEKDSYLPFEYMGPLFKADERYTNSITFRIGGIQNYIPNEQRAQAWFGFTDLIYKEFNDMGGKHEEHPDYSP